MHVQTHDLAHTSHRLPQGVQRVAQALQQWGHGHAPVMLEHAARSAQQAADALGVQLGQIAKSMVFRREHDARTVLVVTAGDRRVDLEKVAQQVGAIGRADAAFVKANSGFSIGGVAPLAHLQPPVALVDDDLFRFDTVWAAAGHPHAVFQLTPDDLCRLLQVTASDVAAAPLEDMPASARTVLSARQAMVQASGSSLVSPCVGVCRMDAESGWCLGCLRTLGEISNWANAPNTYRLAVWDSIGQRLQGKDAGKEAAYERGQAQGSHA